MLRPIRSYQAPTASHVCTPEPHPAATNTNKNPFTFIQDAYRSYLEFMDSDDSKSRAWKHCSHYKAKFVYAPGLIKMVSGNPPDPSFWWVWSTSVKTYQVPGEFGSWYEPITGLIPLYGNVQGGYFVTRPPNVDSLIAESVKTMLPKIAPAQSLLNNLLELKDFKSLPRTINGCANWFNQFPRLIKNYSALVKSGKTLRFILRQSAAHVSDAALQAQFNILPLSSDLQKSISAFRSLDKRINKLLAEEGLVKIARFARSLQGDYPNSDVTGGVNTWPIPGYGYRQARRQVVYTSSPMFRAQMAYSYKLSAYERANARVLGIMDTLGVGGFKPSVIWNAIPWSFVVDWFAGVSQWIKSNVDTNAIDPITNIHGYMYSFHCARDVTLQSDLTATFGTPGPIGSNPVPVGTLSEEAYLRVPVPGISPYIYSSLKLSGINPKEFILSLLLTLSRGK